MSDNTRKLLSSFTLGDMLVKYMIDADQLVTLELLPIGMEDKVKPDEKIYRPDSLVQLKLIGDNYPGTLAGGVTMMNSDTTKNMKYDHQDVVREQVCEESSTVNAKEMVFINTYLKDGRGHTVIHHLKYVQGDYSFETCAEFVNESSEKATLEYITSFAIGNLSPVVNGQGDDAYNIYRIRSKWSHEGRLIKEKAADLQLENSWVNWHPISVRYGQRGSMPVREYSPFGAVEDEKNNIVWAAQLAIECSWQMEFYRRDHALVFAGGLADREFGHWMKDVAVGESFVTPSAIVTVSKGDIDYACQRLTHYGNKFMVSIPQCEQNLPVLFNEYCTTWGLPSHENIMNTVNAIKGHDIKYFVIDCGWYVEEGKSWGDGMGDYIPSDKLFPEGIKHTVDCIKEAGFKPGIWFEIDNAGHDSHIYQNEDMFIKRDGLTLTTESRRYFDMTKPEVISYLDDKVINQINDYGFEYVKMDYNDTIGLGCDGAESLGEGLRLNREASVNYVKRMLEKCPGLVVENCASGGHKLEPLMMSICSMASFSDAHECEHMPLIAAGLHRTILPRQSQIWAVIRKDDSIKRIAYTLANTFLGRMCFSGDVTELTNEQWAKIDEGIQFYHKVSSVIKNGYTYFDKHTGSSDRYLTGYQTIIRVENDGVELIPDKPDKALVVVHIFNECDAGKIEITLPENCPKNIVDVYKGTAIDARIEGDKLYISPSDSMEAIALLLEIDPKEKANKWRNDWAKNDAKRDANLVEPENVKKLVDICYADNMTKEDMGAELNDSKAHLTDIYYPKDVTLDKYPVIVSIHGGGWFYGDKELYRHYAMHMATLGFAVVNFNYRLSPENKYPCGFTDVCYLMDYLARNADKYQLDMNRFFVVGDSAGAQLCSQYSIFATNPSYRKLFDKLNYLKVPVPTKIALNCGIYDMVERATKEDVICSWYLSDDMSENDKESFYHVIDYVTSDFPETYLMLSVNDDLKECTKAMKDKLEEHKISFTYKEFGQDNPDDGHVFHLNMRSKNGKICNDEEAKFFVG